MRRTALLALPLAFALAACEGEPSAAENEGEPGAEVVLPTESDVDAIDAAAKKAEGEVTEANADETLGELEDLINSEDD